MKKCPCNQCICVPVCKNKTIIEINNCDLVSEYITKKIGDPSPPARYWINKWNEVCIVLNKSGYMFDPKHFKE